MSARHVALLCVFLIASMASGALELTWSALPPLPPAPGQDGQPGVAGPFAGVHNGALIVAGGANFPEGPPWEGGKKVWWDDVYVLERARDGAYVWRTHAGFKLPRPLAYGVSVSTTEGVVCLGGCDAEQCYRDVFLLKWNPVTKCVATERLPGMPHKLAFGSGALVGQTVYVTGGQVITRRSLATNHFWALDLSKRDAAAFRWERLPGWPGPPRVLPVAVAQRHGSGECLFLFSGRDAAPERPSRFLTDAYRFVPGSLEWKPVASIEAPGEGVRAVAAAGAAAVGKDHIVLIGGDDGERFLRRERLERAIKEAKDPSQADALRKELAGEFEKHPGFKAEILSYNTRTDTWAVAGQFPTTSHVTTAAVEWQGGVVIVSGEIRPGVRTPKIWLGTWSEDDAGESPAADE